MRSLITTFFERLLAPPSHVSEHTGRAAPRLEGGRLADFVRVVSTLSSTDDEEYIAARDALRQDLNAVLADADSLLSSRSSPHLLRCAAAMALGASGSGRAIPPLLSAAKAVVPVELGAETASNELSVATTAVDALADLARDGVGAARDALGAVALAETSLTTVGVSLAHLSDIGATELFERTLAQLQPAKRYLGALRRIDVGDLPTELNPYLDDAPRLDGASPPLLDVSTFGYRPARGTPILPRPARKPRKD